MNKPVPPATDAVGGAMVHNILARIRAVVSEGTYLLSTSGVPEDQRPALASVADAINAPNADPEAIRRRIHQLHAAGRIDQVMKLSALSVLAASPLVKDHEEAARLASQQEFAALDLGGPHRDAYLASADRHRGVIAFVRGHNAVALDWFTRAFERERTAENAGNVLAALLRLGETAEARALLARMVVADGIGEDLTARVATDSDLALLRA